MASYASSSPARGGTSSYNSATFGSSALNASNTALNELANRFRNNETIGNVVVGRLADNASTLGNIGMADLYNRSTLSTMAEYQRAVDQGRKGDTLEIMGAEGAVTRDLYNTQYAGQERLTRATGEEQRKSYETQGAQERLSIAATGQEQRLLTETQGLQNRLGIMETGQQQRLLADTVGGWDLRRIGAQGSEDRQNIAATGAQQRALAQTQGEEERASQRQGTVEELRRRADARRQASSYGGRFYA